jgi:hypothetical protein
MSSPRRCEVEVVSYFLGTLALSRTLEASFCCGQKSFVGYDRSTQILLSNNSSADVA